VKSVTTTSTNSVLIVDRTLRLKSVEFGIPYDCRSSSGHDVVVDQKFDCLRQYFSTFNRTSYHGGTGCGWVDISQWNRAVRSVVNGKAYTYLEPDSLNNGYISRNANLNVIPKYLYTGTHGWILSSAIINLNDQNTIAGNVVFASSWGNPLVSHSSSSSSSSSSVNVDFEDGEMIGVVNKTNAIWSYKATFVNC